MSGPWLAGLRKRAEKACRYGTTTTPVSSHPAADVLRLVEIADAASEFVATTTVFQQRKVSRDAFTRLAVAVHWPSDPRAAGSQESPS